MIQPSLYCGGAYEKKTIVISILLCAMSLFFYSCSKPEALSVEIAETSTDAVVQGANDSLTFSAGETGVLRIKRREPLFLIINREKIMSSAAELTADITTTCCSGWYEGYRESWVLQNMGGSCIALSTIRRRMYTELVQMNLDGKPPEGYYRD